MKTIIITDEQYQIISDIADKMAKQNNRATQYPLFYVYEKKEVVDNEGAERTAWMNDDWEEVDEFEIDGSLWKYDGEYWTNQGTKEQLDNDEFDDIVNGKLTKQYLKEIDVPVVNVGPFLTEEAANNHIKSNHYHYNKPFTYVNSAWRNYELQEVMKLFFTMLGREVPSQYK